MNLAFFSAVRARRSGITLIEALVSLVLLATVFATVLTIQGRYFRQAALNQKRLGAVAIADALLTEWWSNPYNFPRNQRGRADSSPEYIWSTTRQSSITADKLGLEIWKLTICLDTSPAASPDRANSHTQPELYSLDLVLPPPLTEKPSSEQGGGTSGAPP